MVSPHSLEAEAAAAAAANRNANKFRELEEQAQLLYCISDFRFPALAEEKPINKLLLAAECVGLVGSGGGKGCFPETCHSIASED